jgi:hypothetical protein
MQFGGVIYLREITQSRNTSDMFSDLCAHDLAKHVAFATTKWDEVAEKTGRSRQQQLSDMLPNASDLFSFQDTQESAWKIVKSALDKESIDALQLLKQLEKLARRFS